MSLPELLDIPITITVPTDHETSPERIWKLHLKEVRQMHRHGFDDETISVTLTLPLWSVRRAICDITTGARWRFPTLKEMMAKTSKRSPHLKKLLNKESQCPKEVASPAAKKHQSRRSRSGTSAASIANSRTAKNRSGGKPTAA